MNPDQTAPKEFGLEPYFLQYMLPKAADEKAESISRE